MQVCPNCAAELQFDIATQQLKCPFCGGLFNPATVAAGAAAEEQHYTSTEPVSAAEDQTLDVTPQAAPGAAGFDPNAMGYGQQPQGMDPNTIGMGQVAGVEAGPNGYGVPAGIGVAGTVGAAAGAGA